MSTHPEEDPSEAPPDVNARTIARKFGPFSMMGRRRFIKNLQLAHATKLDMSRHAVVECGVWRGGASFAMMELFPDCPEFHLFDSFEGLPPPGERDGQRALQLSEENLFVEGRNYASYDDLMRSLAEFGFAERAKVHKGWFEDTVTADKIERPIGILRLDGDWYESTKVVLDRLFASVAPGGLIIIDDYFDWPGCSQAVHDFLSERASPEPIRTFDNLVAYIAKRPDDFLSQGVSQKEIARRRQAKTPPVSEAVPEQS